MCLFSFMKKIWVLIVNLCIFSLRTIYTKLLYLTKKSISRVVEMAWQVKAAHPGSAPYICEYWVDGWPGGIITCGGQRWGSLSWMASLGSNERLCLSIWWRQYGRRIPDVNLWPPHTGTHRNIYPHTCNHEYTRACTHKPKKQMSIPSPKLCNSRLLLQTLPITEACPSLLPRYRSQSDAANTIVWGFQCFPDIWIPYPFWIEFNGVR